jgi:hypothetical protein
MSDLSDADLEKIDKELMDSVDLQNPNATVTLLRQRLKNQSRGKHGENGAQSETKQKKNRCPSWSPLNMLKP